MRGFIPWGAPISFRRLTQSSPSPAKWPRSNRDRAYGQLVRTTLDEEIEAYSGSPGYSHLQEALRCYHAQSPRAAVVLAWQAVVHDYIGKLRELASHQHTYATSRLDNHESATDRGHFTFLLDFERKIPQEARAPLGLLTVIEESHLSTAFQERHRCAHPTLNGGSEAYQPTLETARWCIRVALDAMFAKPALVGAQARQVLADLLASATFPTDAARAERLLRRSPLRNADRAVVRYFLKHAIQSSLTDDEYDPYFAAFAATRMLHPQASAEILAHEVPGWVTETDPDDGLSDWVAWVDSAVDLWPFMDEEAQQHLRHHIANSAPDSLAVGLALPFPQFQDAISITMQYADGETLVRSAVEIDQDYGWNLVFDRLAAVANFASANAVLTPLYQRFNDVPSKFWSRILDVADENGQVNGAHGLIPIIQSLAHEAWDGANRAQQKVDDLTGAPAEP